MGRLFGSTAWIGRLLLAGCSLAGAVTRTTLDYNQALKAVTNTILVTILL
nr:hypothetical protein [uncultured Lichenicoccus sp.]